MSSFTVQEHRVRKRNRYLHKNVTLKSVIYVRRRRTSSLRRRRTSSSQRRHDVVVRRRHDVVVRRRQDVVRRRRDDDVRLLLSKQVDTWNIVYQLVHRITTTCKKHRQIFTQECNTRTSYTTSYSCTTYVSYIRTSSSRRRDDVVTSSSYVVVAMSYDDDVTTMYGSC